jgi:hypothetical protein
LSSPATRYGLFRASIWAAELGGLNSSPPTPLSKIPAGSSRVHNSFYRRGRPLIGTPRK